MGTRLTRTKALVAAGAVAVASAAMLVGTTGVSGASSPSDVRADFHAGNAVDCGDVGFGDATTAFANNDDDINVDGIVGTASGTTVNIATPLPDNIVIVAVVVKGGPAYNVYTEDSGDGLANYTPLGVEAENSDGLASPQNYISPLNGGGNVPAISHWFICYTGGDTPPPPDHEPGNLRLQKAIVAPVAGVTPTSFSVHVTCDDGTTADVSLPGDGTIVLVPVAEINTFCTVKEAAQTVPNGFTGAIVVTYNPTDAETAPGNDGVEVPGDGEDSAVVTVTNSYANVAANNSGQASQPASAVQVAPSFTG